VLIHSWDASLETAEWQEWLGHTDRFGVLAVNNADPGQAPVLVPTHFTVAGDELLVHLARPNPVWAHLEAATEVRLAVVGDYAYIPTYWRAKAGGPDEDGVPTSYYAAVQFVCRPTIVDDPEGKVDILTTQLGDFQPEGGYATVASVQPRTGGCCAASGVCGWRCCGWRPSSNTTTTTRSITGSVSSTISSSAGAVSIRVPRCSSAAAWPRSATGTPSATGNDQRVR
jgi:hypothetical protein